MTDDEAINICERWFRYLDGQREKTLTLQRAASLARAGQVDEARRITNQVDRQPRVFDGATLEPAVRHLIQRVTVTNTNQEE